MSRRIVVLGLVWALTQVACSSTEPDACGPVNCTGCCTASGLCARGVDAPTCGIGGAACKDCGALIQCGMNGQCIGPAGTDGGTSDAGTDGGTLDAGAPPPCGATALTLVNGKAQVSGTTVGAERQAIGSCGGIDGSEVLHSFTLTHDTNVVITVTPRDTAFQPVVYLRQGRCDASQDELYQGCVAAHLPGATVQLQTLVTSPGSGTYFVVVDGLSDAGGAFDLSVETGSRTGDNCAGVLPLPGRQFTVRGSYRGADDSSKPSCNRAGSEDRVYRLDTSEPAYLRARVEDGDGFYSSVLALADLCGGQELACDYALDSVLLSPGSHYLWLDRHLNTSDNPGYILRAELTAPLPGDTCAQARPLVFSTGAQGDTATDKVTAAGLHDDGNWSCGVSNGADLAYAFTTDRKLAFHASATDSTGHALPLTLVRTACTPDARVACGTSSLDVAELPAGSYFLWVDGLHENSGTVSLTASLE
ncbi:MAG TPA: hypothetical protein VF794_37380 [Archangium sp.]|uniref:hypothetical protein n=1 Tax=Archangium sp. TaxID=1872627 RepID=UPI002ED9060B